MKFDCSYLISRSCYKKSLEPNVSTSLNRQLSTWRLTFVGVGSTIGVGIFVLIGTGTKDLAGPAVVISFLVAGIAALLNAICFAEFGAKTSRTGAAYAFVFSIYGEFAAFIVGWNYLLGGVASTAVAARAWSGYVDSLFDHVVRNFTINLTGTWDIGAPVSEYPDMMAFGIQFVIVVVSAAGVTCSSNINTLLSTITMTILLFIIVLGFTQTDISNWQNIGHGGFFPFGIKGVIAGAAGCFYAFQGYETICMSAEESKNPERSVPRAIVFTMLIIMVLYCSVAVSFTLMVPYWLVDTIAPFPAAFDYVGIGWAKYIISTSISCVFTNLLLLSNYSLSRLIYTIAYDGLLCNVCTVVNKRTKVPLMPLLISGLSSAFLALFLDLKNLIGFLVLTSLLVYLILALGLIITRYNTEEEDHVVYSRDKSHDVQQGTNNTENGSISERGHKQESDKDQTNASSMQYYAQQIGFKYPLALAIVSAFIFSYFILHGEEDIIHGYSMAVMAILILVGLILFSLIVIHMQKQVKQPGFQVPWVPYVPFMTAMLNIVLILSLVTSKMILTLIVWYVIGAIIYLFAVLCGTRKDRMGNVEERTELMSEIGSAPAQFTNDGDFWIDDD